MLRKYLKEKKNLGKSKKKKKKKTYHVTKLSQKSKLYTIELKKKILQ